MTKADITTLEAKLKGSRLFTSSVHGNEQAPTIFFDEVPAYGAVHGIVQLELSAATIIPDQQSGQPRTVHVVAGHIRCSPIAALALRAAIDAALAFIQQPTEKPTEPVAH